MRPDFACYFFLFISLFAGRLNGQTSIAQAKMVNEGESVTIEGVATNGAELDIIRYVQDATGGLAVYPGDGSTGDLAADTKRGDRIRVTGTMSIFHGLQEINPVTSYEVLSSDNDLPDPMFLNVEDLNEDSEGRLVKVFDVQFADGGQVFEDNQTYQINSNTGSAIVYIRRDHPLVGTNIPPQRVNITGISSQFDDYQLLIRDGNDIEISSDFYISMDLTQSNIGQDGFDLAWATSLPSDSYVVLWDDNGFQAQFGPSDFDFNHEENVGVLSPASFYFAQAVALRGMDTIKTPVQLFSTSSTSSGEIEVYFTTDIDDSYSNGSMPNGVGGSVIEDEIIRKIENAHESIDFCAYNINRDVIVNALQDARNRGVVVRYVHNIGTSNTALSPLPNFPIHGVNSSNLMHNKFVVIDMNSINDSWVITGSMNYTDNNVFADHNNVVMIQDQALGRAYTLEFEEMWGSSSSVPNPSNSKSGSQKSNNTPHLFDINGTIVESYFSPSDRANKQILRALSTADKSVAFALLSFTRADLAGQLIDSKNAGVWVRGLIESTGDQNSAFSPLLNAGVAVGSHPPGATLHHKYGIVDFDEEDSDPLVITGSHNWSNSAELDNDENTLIIHDADIANLFRQEFEARWGEGSVSVYGAPYDEANPDFNLMSWRSNAVSEVELILKAQRKQKIVISIVNVLGRVLVEEQTTLTSGLNHVRIPLASSTAELLWLRLANTTSSATYPFITVKK